MQKYKEYMSHIHAPEELIAKTIRRVKDEESKRDDFKSSNESVDNRVYNIEQSEITNHIVNQDINRIAYNNQAKNQGKHEIQIEDYEPSGESIINGDNIRGEDNAQSEGKIIKFKKRKRKKYIAIGISAVAAVFIGININLSMNAVSYTDISLDMLRSQDVNTKYEKMSLEDYEKYLGISLSALVSNNESSLENVDIKAVMDGNGVAPDLDQAVFYFSIDGESNMILRVSKTKVFAPDELLENKESKIGKYKVHLGENEEIGKLYAGGKMHGVNFFVSGSKIEKKDFEKNLEKYFDCMKPFEK